MKAVRISAQASRTGSGWGGSFPSVRVAIADDEVALTSRQARRLMEQLEAAVLKCEQFDRQAAR